MASTDMSLMAVFGGDTRPLEQSVKRAGAAISDFTSKAAKNGFGDLIAPIAKVTAAVGSVGAVMAGIKGALDLGSEMTDLSNRTGIAVENLMGLRKGFKDAGVDAAALGPAVNKMQKGLASAVAGGSESNVLKSLGLDAQTLASEDPGKAFAQIGNAIAALPNSTDRAAASIALFGKSGAELLQVFMDPNFKDAGNVSNAARLLGENAGVFDKASDALGHVGGKLQGLFIGMAAGSADFLNQLADGIDGIDLTGIGQSLGNIAGNFSTNFSDELAKVMQFLQDAITTIFSRDGLTVILDGFYYIGAQIRDFLVKVFKAPLDYLEAGLQKAVESAMEMVGKIPVLGDKLGLKGFKATDFNTILGDVQSRGNGLTNLVAEDQGNTAASGQRAKSALAIISEKLKESIQPVITATSETDAKNRQARAANENRIRTNDAYNPEAIGMGGKASIVADSLAKVGGGSMGTFLGVIEVNRQQLAAQNRTNSILEKIAGGGGGFAPAAQLAR